MCEIRLISRATCLSNKDFAVFIDLMAASATRQKDAWGYFTENCLFKKIGNSIKDEIAYDPHTSFICGHTRTATSGTPNDNSNNHPFVCGEWIIIHNGILSRVVNTAKEHGINVEEQSVPSKEVYKYNKLVTYCETKIDGVATDSYLIAKLLDKFEKDGKNPVECIESTAGALCGTYSVVAYNKKFNRLFYFKSLITDFIFARVDDILYGSTVDLNDIHISSVTDNSIEWVKDEKAYFYPQEGKVYEVIGSSLEAVGSFKVDKYTQYDYYDDWYGYRTYSYDEWEGWRNKTYNPLDADLSIGQLEKKHKKWWPKKDGKRRRLK